MKPLTQILLCFCILMLCVATQCDDDTIGPSCNDRLDSLSELNDQIQALVNTSECSDAFECRAIAFGSKPCGGPWEYLIYTTSIDTLELQTLVDEYNSIEADYNLNCDSVSDCAFVSPPSGFECSDGQCIPQF